jgi:hypothetical protein
MFTNQVRRSKLRRMFALAGVVVLMTAGCSEDTKDKAGDVGESLKEDAKDNTGKLAAFAVAETFRSSLKANAAAMEEGLRSMAALEEVKEDIPGNPDITEIKDDDGDGLDDDGKVLIKASDKFACVIIPETGDDTEVKEGAC